MRTVCGLARRVQRLVSRRRDPPPVAGVRRLVGTGRPLVADRVGEQRRGGARLDQVDGTTCGSAVLVALSAWADAAELARLDGTDPVAEGVVPRAALGAAAGPTGFGARYDARQLQVHRETNRFWPKAFGTTPWGMVGWLRRNAPAAGPYRVRLVDDRSAADVAELVAAVGAALVAGRPVPLLVGPFVPRHYVLVLGAGEQGWRVYEPTSGSVRALDLDLLRQHRLTPVLGFDRLHAALLPT